MRHPTHLLLASLLALAPCLAGCGGESESDMDGTVWGPVAESALTEGQKAQQAKGVEAKEALFKRLLGRLMQAMADGHGEAISTCRVAAPEIAAAVGDEKQLRIGRTSFKLRNPENVPPDWARSYVEARHSEPLWLAHADGRLAGLLPIRMQAICLMCHGDPASIPTAVREALAAQYPEDKATGFAKGDLRGWFWLEVPAP